MKISAKQLEFGLRDAIPDRAVAGWGARAIILSGNRLQPRFDLLPDRQDAFAKTEAAALALRRVLRFYPGVIDRAQQTYEELVERGELRANVHQVFKLVAERGFRIVANPRASCGYLYMAGWFEPGDVEDANVALCLGDDCYDQALADGDPDEPKWSGLRPPPPLGTEVFVESGVRRELRGPATVVGYLNTHGYVMAYVVGTHQSDDTPGAFGVYGCDLGVAKLATG